MPLDRFASNRGSKLAWDSKVHCDGGHTGRDSEGLKQSTIAHKVRLPTPTAIYSVRSTMMRGPIATVEEIAAAIPDGALVALPREIDGAAMAAIGALVRRGGPYALVTGRCLFHFDRARHRFRLTSVHPGHDADEITEHTGFTFDRPPEVPVTLAPDRHTVAVLRERVAAEIAEVYPCFAETVFGGARTAA